MKIGDKVMPRAFPVTCKGYMWEFELWQRGYNNLPESERPLTVSSLDVGGDVASITHPLVNQPLVVWPNEVVAI